MEWENPLFNTFYLALWAIFDLYTSSFCLFPCLNDGLFSFAGLEWPSLAFEVTSDLRFELYNISLLYFHALLALFHTFSYFKRKKISSICSPYGYADGKKSPYSSLKVQMNGRTHQNICLFSCLEYAKFAWSSRYYKHAWAGSLGNLNVHVHAANNSQSCQSKRERFVEVPFSLFRRVLNVVWSFGWSDVLFFAGHQSNVGYIVRPLSSPALPSPRLPSRTASRSI